MLTRCWSPGHLQPQIKGLATKYTTVKWPIACKKTIASLQVTATFFNAFSQRKIDSDTLDIAA